MCGSDLGSAEDSVFRAVKVCPQNWVNVAPHSCSQSHSLTNTHRLHHHSQQWDPEHSQEIGGKLGGGWRENSSGPFGYILMDISFHGGESIRKYQVRKCAWKWFVMWYHLNIVWFSCKSTVMNNLIMAELYLEICACDKKMSEISHWHQCMIYVKVWVSQRPSKHTDFKLRFVPFDLSFCNQTSNLTAPKYSSNIPAPWGSPLLISSWVESQSSTGPHVNRYPFLLRGVRLLHTISIIDMTVA